MHTRYVSVKGPGEAWTGGFGRSQARQPVHAVPERPLAIPRVDRQDRRVSDDPSPSIEALRPRRSLWLRCVLGLGALLATVLLIVVGALVYWRSRRVAALDRQRASSAPVLPEDIRFARRDGAPGFEEWCARFAALEEVEPRPLFELPDCADLLPTREREFGLSAELSAEFNERLLDGEPFSAELSAALGESNPGLDAESDFLEDLEFALVDPRRANELTECQRAVLRQQRDENAPQLALALQLEGLAGPDRALQLRGGDTLEELVPRPLVAGLPAVAQLLARSAGDAARGGDSEAAVHRLTLLFDLASMLDDSPILVETWVRDQLESIAGAGLEQVLLVLPAGVDLSAVEARMDGPDPLAQLRFALLGERAIVNRIFAALGANGASMSLLFDVPSADAGYARWLRDFDQAQYHERTERTLAALDLPYDEACAELSRIDDEGVSELALVTQMMAPRVESLATYCAQAAALRHVRRAVLIAYRDGVEAAQEWASAQPDPFGHSNLLARIDDDGVLTVWSVGSNGVDDGAPLPPWKPEDWGEDWPPDIAVRFRAR